MSSIDFLWRGGTSESPGGGLQDNFSARYTGSIDFAADTYRFTLGADDGAKLWVDGTLLIDNWPAGGQSYTEKTATLALAAGSHNLKVEYYEGGWDAQVKLAYEAATAPPPPPPGPSDVYHVSGRQILDPCGQQIVARGVEQDFWGEAWINHPEWVDQVAQTGANTMRILLQIDGNVDGRVPLSLAQAEGYIQRGIADHMLVDVAINGGKTPDAYLRADVKALLQKYEKNIVIHAVGEASESTETAWATHVKDVISKMRAAGYRSPLYVMANGGGRQLRTLLNKGVEVQNADPLHNTVFGWQAYWGVNQTDNSNYWANQNGTTLAGAMQQVRDAQVPIQVGAIALADPNQWVDYPSVLKDAQSYGIGWLWWDWALSSSFMRLTTDGIYGHWFVPTDGPVAYRQYASQVAATGGSLFGIPATSTKTAFQQTGACAQ